MTLVGFEPTTYSLEGSSGKFLFSRPIQARLQGHRLAEPMEIFKGLEVKTQRGTSTALILVINSSTTTPLIRETPPAWDI